MNTPKIGIVTDSSANIPATALIGLDVTTIPLWLIWDGQLLKDGVDMDPGQFYQRLKTAKTLPTSSQPTPGEFMDLFRKLSKKMDAIVAVLASSKISGTCASAEKARDQLPDKDICVVDSQSSSMGQGLIVLAAAEAAAQGKSMDEVVRTAEWVREKMQFIFLVDTLEFLHRSGRIKAAKRVLGSILKVKPMLHFQDGLIQPLTSERTLGKAIARMMTLIEERLCGRQMAQVAVVDVDCRTRGDQIAGMIQERFNPERILCSEVSPVVGNVVGPGAFGVAFYPVG